MALFSKSDQVASIEAELADLQDRRWILDRKLAAATAAVERAAGDRQKFLIEGDRVDDSLRTDINVRLIAAQSAELGLRDAVGQLGARIGDAERRLAAERDRVAREAAAKAINADSDTLAAAIASFDQAGKAMVAALGPLAARLPASIRISFRGCRRSPATSERRLASWSPWHALMPHGSWTAPPRS